MIAAAGVAQVFAGCPHPGTKPASCRRGHQSTIATLTACDFS